MLLFHGMRDFCNFEIFIPEIKFKAKSTSFGMFHHILSQDDVSLYFHKFYLRSFKAEKGVKF